MINSRSTVIKLILLFYFFILVCFLYVFYFFTFNKVFVYFSGTFGMSIILSTVSLLVTFEKQIKVSKGLIIRTIAGTIVAFVNFSFFIIPTDCFSYIVIFCTGLSLILMLYSIYKIENERKKDIM